MKTRTKRESHAKMMLGLAKTALARAEASEDSYLIEQARFEVEHWKQILDNESSPLTSARK